MIIPKNWGFEDVAVNTGAYCGKRMLVKEQRRSSIHKHEKKDETLMVGGEGLVWFEMGPEPAKMSGFWMQENDRARVEPGTWHRFTAMRDALLYEFSTHHEDSDVVREVPSGEVPDEEFKVLLGAFVKFSSRARVLEIPEAEAVATALRAAGKVVGFCNGCFDLMHLGHAELLLQAKLRCDVLFVAVNTDESVQKLKGASRPYVDEVGRMGMVASNRYVDYVVRNEKMTCVDAVKAVRPHVYVKTSEHGAEGPEAKEVVAMGGTIDVVDVLPGYKTTRIATKVVQSVR
jgi:rfaE bifunctional protein nucleotidyltransferase chain/domain